MSPKPHLWAVMDDGGRSWLFQDLQSPRWASGEWSLATTSGEAFPLHRSIAEALGLRGGSCMEVKLVPKVK